MLNRHTSAAVLRRRCAAAEESKLQPYWCGKRGLMEKTCPLAFYPFCSQPGPSTRAGMQCKGLQRHFSCCNVSAQSMRAVIHDSQKCIKDTLTPCAIWAAVGASVCCMHLWLLGLLAHHPMSAGTPKKSLLRNPGGMHPEYNSRDRGSRSLLQGSRLACENYEFAACGGIATHLWAARAHTGSRTSKSSLMAN